MSSFDKSFDELFQETLTAWQNQFPGADSSQGSMLFMRSALLAAARWGIHKHAAWVYDQADPLTAARPSLERWALRRGLPLIPGESDSALLTRILDRERNPPAGGNEPDYIRWAREVYPTLGDGRVYKDMEAQGLGTVDLVVWGQEGNLVLSSDHRTLIYNYIMAKRPAGLYLLRVMPITLTIVSVTMSGVGPALADIVANEIAVFVNTQGENKPLYRSQLISIAVQAGVPNPTLVLPVADVIPDPALHEFFVASINVT